MRKRKFKVMQRMNGLQEGTTPESRKRIARDPFSRRDKFGRLHGVQPTFGTGMIVYEYGTLEYLDDGNGNVFDSSHPDYDEY